MMLPIAHQKKYTCALVCEIIGMIENTITDLD